MMPKKAESEKRSNFIGIKVNEDCRKKLNYLAGAKGETTSTYIFNLLQKHIEEKEPWITKEIIELEKEEKQ